MQDHSEQEHRFYFWYKHKVLYLQLGKNTHAGKGFHIFKSFLGDAAVGHEM